MVPFLLVEYALVHVNAKRMCVNRIPRYNPALLRSDVHKQFPISWIVPHGPEAIRGESIVCRMMLQGFDTSDHLEPTDSLYTPFHSQRSAGRDVSSGQSRRDMIRRTRGPAFPDAGSKGSAGVVTTVHVGMNMLADIRLRPSALAGLAGDGEVGGRTFWDRDKVGEACALFKSL